VSGRRAVIATLLLTAAVLRPATPPTAAQTGVTIANDTRMEPPRWAVLERQLLAANVPALREFFAKYFDERGYIQCFVRWGANDGPDDGFENFNRWPELHALGASDEVLRLYTKGQGGCRLSGARAAVRRPRHGRRS
jgi:hypothetical protein